ncbi:MAG: hypothetical protein KKA05_03930, partial [Alphaproteobacteria bacterium]|nr:hypothetical protein [Alphaproteobacteria bacterium]
MADSEDHKKRDSLWGRLRNGTVLGSFTARPRVPESVMNAMRYLAEEPDTDDSPGTNPYERAKQRFNRIWAGRDAYAGAEGDISPVSKFKTLRGALTAFWTGEKWAQAWASTGATLGVAALNAKNTVWISVASADFVNS